MPDDSCKLSKLTRNAADNLENILAKLTLWKITIIDSIIIE